MSEGKARSKARKEVLIEVVVQATPIYFYEF